MRRFLVKGAVQLSAIGGGVLLLAEFNPSAEAARQFIYDNPPALWGFLLLYFALLAVYEVLLSFQRAGLERLRSDPLEPRRRQNLRRSRRLIANKPSKRR